MNAQRSNRKNTQDRLATTTDKRASAWALLLGLLMSDLGLLLIAFAGWDALRARAQTLFYSGGGALCFLALVLIWIGTQKLADAAHEQTDTLQRELPEGTAANAVYAPDFFGPTAWL